MLQTSNVEAEVLTAAATSLLWPQLLHNQPAIKLRGDGSEETCVILHTPAPKNEVYPRIPRAQRRTGAEDQAGGSCQAMLTLASRKS